MPNTVKLQAETLEEATEVMAARWPLIEVKRWMVQGNRIDSGGLVRNVDYLGGVLTGATNCHLDLFPYLVAIKRLIEPKNTPAKSVMRATFREANGSLQCQIEDPAEPCF